MNTFIIHRSEFIIPKEAERGLFMKGILAIYRREVGSYFVSPIAYVVIGMFLLATGFVFSIILANIIERTTMMQMRAAQTGQMPEIDVPIQVIRAFVGFVGTYLLPILMPLVTMGVYSEERKRGTMELLMTSPVTELQIVLGKFLATLTLFEIGRAHV